MDIMGRRYRWSNGKREKGLKSSPHTGESLFEGTEGREEYGGRRYKIYKKMFY